VREGNLLKFSVSGFDNFWMIYIVKLSSFIDKSYESYSKKLFKEVIKRSIESMTKSMLTSSQKVTTGGRGEGERSLLIPGGFIPGLSRD
jgi:hypothetical protein